MKTKKTPQNIFKCPLCGEGDTVKAYFSWLAESPRLQNADGGKWRFSLDQYFCRHCGTEFFVKPFDIV